MPCDRDLQRFVAVKPVYVDNRYSSGRALQSQRGAAINTYSQWQLVHKLQRVCKQYKHVHLVIAINLINWSTDIFLFIIHWLNLCFVDLPLQLHWHSPVAKHYSTCLPISPTCPHSLRDIILMFPFLLLQLFRGVFNELPFPSLPSIYLRVPCSHRRPVRLQNLQTGVVGRLPTPHSSLLQSLSPRLQVLSRGLLFNYSHTV